MNNVTHVLSRISVQYKDDINMLKIKDATDKVIAILTDEDTEPKFVEELVEVVESDTEDAKKKKKMKKTKKWSY
jgi:hypothetical protein